MDEWGGEFLSIQETIEEIEEHNQEEGIELWGSKSYF
jgi:hypothetical protein